MSNIVETLATRARVTVRWRWAVVIVLFGAVVVGFFDRISVAVLFTNADFYTSIGTGFNPAKLGFLMSGFLLAYGFSSLALSVVGDIFGQSRTLAAIAALWGVFMAAMGASSSYAAMMFLRIALGITEGPQFSLISKVVHRWFPEGERGRANSVWMVGSPIGSAIGFPLSLWLVHSYGWRALFFVFGALSFFFMSPLIFAVTRDRKEAMPIETVAAPKQKVDLSLFLGNYRFWLVTLYGCGLLMYLWGLNSWLPTYLERSRHFNLHDMGIYSSLPFILMFIGEVASGFISDRLGKRALLCAIGLFGAGCLLYVGTIIADPHLAAIVIALSAGCWGIGLPAQYALAMDIIPAPVIATGIGVLNGISNLTGACAPALIGWIVGRTGSFQTGLLVIVFASVLGSLVILPLARRY
ncbi:MFS transporter [Caballeronia sp. dw_19]|uniref:MFS transporter n=1 Tax=Caballeronia sp. dw_19 TaxID=2719791 RepID=UPI001BD62337|nr:MFS transporter [Caballeronia sp. dw_19]